jgi:hypothetical protein
MREKNSSLFPPDIVYRARHTELVDFFKSKGFELERQGLRYKIRGYGGLFVFNSCFYQHTTDLYGNSIDCLMKVFGLSFQESVSELTGSSNFTISCNAKMEKKIKPPFDFNSLELNKNQHRAFAYLNKTRHIDKKLIQYLLKHRLLFQDTRGNCVFPFYDEVGKIVGAECVGTLTDYRFKGVSENSKLGYGFSLKFGMDNIYFFESAIDLLSFICLFSSKRDFSKSMFVSMGGLKGSCLFNYYSLIGSSSNYFICVDNDSKGDRFFSNISDSMDGVNRIVPVSKDFNKDLGDSLAC